MHRITNVHFPHGSTKDAGNLINWAKKVLLYWGWQLIILAFQAAKWEGKRRAMQQKNNSEYRAENCIFRQCFLIHSTKRKCKHYECILSVWEKFWLCIVASYVIDPLYFFGPQLWFLFTARLCKLHRWQKLCLLMVCIFCRLNHAENKVSCRRFNAQTFINEAA